MKIITGEPTLTFSKSALFKIFGSMLKRKSVSGIEQLEADFDRCLGETLGLFRGIRMDVCGKNDSKATSAILQGVLGDDVMQSHDLTLSMQVLALYARMNTPKYPQTIYPFMCRLHMLIIVVGHYIHEFSFLKTALLLNSLANILNAGIVPDYKVHESFFKFLVPKGYVSTNFHKLYEACEDPSIGTLHASLIRLNSIVESHLKSLLFLSLFHKNDDRLRDLKVGEPDAHSICMVLKYYSIFSKIDEKLLYMIYLWIKKLEEWKIVNVINILRSVTKLYKVSNVVNLEEFEKTLLGEVRVSSFFVNNPQVLTFCYETIGKFPNKKGPANIIELIISHIIRAKVVDQLTLNQIQSYFQSLNTAYIGGICKKSDMREKLTELISSAKIALEYDKDVVGFINSLYFAQIAHNELDVIEFDTIASLLFANNNHNILFHSTPKLFVKGSPSNLTKTLSFLNVVQKNKELLIADEAKVVEELFSKLLKYIPDVLREHSKFTITELITLKRISNSHDNDLKNYLLNIYSNALSGQKNTHYTLSLLKQTDDLFVFLYSSNWILGDGLHNIIGSFLSINCTYFTKHNAFVFLRLLQNISRLYKANKGWSNIYDMKLFLKNIFNSSWEVHTDLIIDIIFNSVVNTNLELNEVASMVTLEDLFYQCYLRNLQMYHPSVENNKQQIIHPNINITLFSKFFHLSWLSKTYSAKLHDIWAKCLSVLLDCHALFDNKFISDDGKSVVSSSNSYHWQSFSARIVISTLLNVDDRDFYHPLSQNDRKIFRTIDSIFIKVGDYVNTFGDNHFSVYKLHETITQNSDRLRSCTNLEKIISLLRSSPLKG